MTGQTLELLDDEYFYEPGTKAAKMDRLLVNNDIETFLISPQYYGDARVSWTFYRISGANDIKENRVQFQYYAPDEVSRRFSSGIKKMIGKSVVSSADI